MAARAEEVTSSHRAHATQSFSRRAERYGSTKELHRLNRSTLLEVIKRAEGFFSTSMIVLQVMKIAHAMIVVQVMKIAHAMMVMQVIEIAHAMIVVQVTKIVHAMMVMQVMKTAHAMKAVLQVIKTVQVIKSEKVIRPGPELEDSFRGLSIFSLESNMLPRCTKCPFPPSVILVLESAP